MEYVDNLQNYRSKSGICCWVQTSFLLVDGCCFNCVHVPASFSCCERQPVVLREATGRVFMMLPRERFVLYWKTVEHRFRKSRDFLQTGEFTSGDKLTHFCVCCDSFQCSCMRTVAHLFLRVLSISNARLREGFLFWTMCLKTFHLGTVCVCLAWSSHLPRYCCCVVCLYCDLDT